MKADLILIRTDGRTSVHPGEEFCELPRSGDMICWIRELLRVRTVIHNRKANKSVEVLAEETHVVWGDTAKMIQDSDATLRVLRECADVN